MLVGEKMFVLFGNITRKSFAKGASIRTASHIVQTLVKYRIKWHFIRVFTVNQSTCLPVSGLKMVDEIAISLDC